MNKEVKKILLDNNLYIYENNPIDFNNEKEFFTNYKINNTNIHNFSNKVKQNNKGYYIFDEAPFIKICYNTDGNSPKFWILLDNGSKILFKKIEKDEMNIELLYESFANNLNIKNANYNIGTLDNEIYLISNSFLSNEDILFDYYNIKGKNMLDVEKLIVLSKKINEEYHLKKVLIMDILSKNYDRFPHNFKVIIKDGKIKTSPLFDNGLSGITEKYKARFLVPAYKNKVDDYSLLSFLLSDDKIKEWCINVLLKINENNFKKNIFDNKKIYIDEKYNNIFINNVKEGKQKIKTIIKQA